MPHAKVRQKNESTKLTFRNFLFLLGGVASVFATYIAYTLSFWGVGFFCLSVTGLLFYLLLSPSIRWLPPHRHAVTHLSISGRTKEIRFVRLADGGGVYYPTIFTPKTIKKTAQVTTNQRLVRDGSTVRLEAQIAPQDVFVNNGDFHAVVFDDFELTEKSAVFLFACLLVKSKNDTLFETVALRKYLQGFSHGTMFFGELVVTVVFFVAKLHHFRYLLNAKIPSPTLSKTVQNAKKSANSTMLLKKILIGKEVANE